MKLFATWMFVVAASIITMVVSFDATMYSLARIYAA